MNMAIPFTLSQIALAFSSTTEFLALPQQGDSTSSLTTANLGHRGYDVIRHM